MEKSKSGSVKCPHCSSDQYFYVQKSIEYHHMSDKPDKDGFVPLHSLGDSVSDDDFEPYIRCLECMNAWDLFGKKLTE